jgi:hypothetical protein
VDQIKNNIHDTLAAAKTIEAMSINVASGIETIGRELDHLSLSFEGTAHKQDQLILAHTAHSHKQDQVGLSVQSSLQKQDQMMVEILHYAQRQEQRHEQLLERMQLLLNQPEPRRSGSLVEITNLHTRLTQESELQLVDAPARSCTCRAVRSTRSWNLTSMVRLIQTSRTMHFSWCAAYGDSEMELTNSIQFTPPAWLLSRTVDVGMQVKNLWSTRPMSIIPIIIGTNRLIDPATSPAFRAIKIADDKLPIVGKSKRAIMMELERTLRDLFAQGQASVLDTDRNGRTLLTVGAVYLIPEDRNTTDTMTGSRSIVCHEEF